ncbi:MAG: hypothetical protein ACE5NG_03945 [bacterium]
MTGRTQSGVLAKSAGRSITRMVQLRESGQTVITGRVWLWDKPHGSGAIRRPFDYAQGRLFCPFGEGQSLQGRKGREHLQGTRSNAGGMRREIAEVGPEVPVFKTIIRQSMRNRSIFAS